MDRKEKLLGFMEKQAKVPLLPDEIALMLGASDKITDVLNILDELCDEGKIIKTKRGRYEAALHAGIYTGTFRGNKKSFGFVIHEDGDFYISPEHCADALSGDTVVVKEIKSSKRSREGIIVKVTEHANKTLCGVYKKGKIFVCGDVNAVFSATNASAEFEKCRVIFSVLDYKKKCGKIISNLGKAASIESEMSAIMHEYGIEEEFNYDVLRCAKKSSEKPIDIENRVDLRQLKTFTIDGADARDFDDAVSIEKQDFGYRLYVHIADVSYYVEENSALDKEAMKRGTSCYFPERVCPMLPKILSNGICSINPGEERAALTTRMNLDENGSLIDCKIFSSVIISDHRLVYEKVSEMLENQDSLYWKNCEDIKAELYMMRDLAMTLRGKRFEKGSMDFNIPEPKIILDKKGKTYDVLLYEHTVAHKIIEEFMLLCNKTAAEHAFWAQIPFVYRVHESPDEKKIYDFLNFISLFGIKIPGKICGKRLMDMLQKIKNKPYERVINMLLLRSMSKALYSTENIGHFGLGASYYCHFTSPIRRYPDLVCHRMIKKLICGENTEAYGNYVKEAAKISTEREQAAADAERNAVKLRICELMENYIGHTFEAIISSVTSFGFFAEIEECIEGLVRLADLKGDYYLFDEKTLSLRGERHGRTYKIGDIIPVTVAKVDREMKTIDFLPAGLKRKK